MITTLKGYQPDLSAYPVAEDNATNQLIVSKILIRATPHVSILARSLMLKLVFVLIVNADAQMEV
jgi:hypothetical protein